MNFQISKKIVVGLLSASWLMMSGMAAAQEEAAPPPNPAAGTYFEKMRLNTQKFETVKTGNYLREDYICQSVPSACRDANAQEAEDRWYPALPAYTTWSDDGAPHSHESWLPAPTTQMSAFDQSQNYLQPQTRLRQEREQAVPSGDFRSIGEPQQENRDDSRVSTRNVTVNILTFVPDGNSFNCSTWLPEVGTVNLGEEFTQTRNCDQNAARDVEYYTDGSLIATSSDAGIVTIEETQPATGTRDFINGERADEWGEWVDSGELYDCSPWTPLPDTQPLESAFIQTAECSIDQTRERQVYNVFASGAETELRIDTENQTVDRQDSQDAIGAEDFIDSERIGDWKDVWEIVQPQVNTNCGPWSPLPSTVDWGNSFTQTRTCDTTEEDFRDIFDVYKSGREEVREVEQRTRVVQVEETKSETGARDFVESTYDVDGAWINQGALYNCVWTPDPDTIDIGEAYTQNAECDRNQTRTITTYNVWASGQADSVASTRDENRTIKENTSRSETGTGQPVIQYGAWGSWATGSVQNCTSWGPATTTVDWGNTFTQTRTCEYAQERFRSRTNLYPSGRTEALSDQRDTRTLTAQSESRSETGTRDFVSSTYEIDGAWVSQGALANCVWTPDPSTIDIGVTFTQNAQCDRDQSRTVTSYEKWASGKDDTVSGTRTETRVIKENTSRSQTGTGQPVIQYGAWGAYSTVSKTACTAWSPAESTVNLGASFTQDRTCTYNQERSRSRTNLYPSGRTEALSPEVGTRALTLQAENRTNTGAQDYVTSTYNTFSNWTTVANDKTCSAWTPATSTIDVGTSFTQDRTCVDGQSRVRTEMQKWASGRADTPNGTATETRDVNDAQSRTETGTGQPVIQYGAWGSWSTTATRDCTPWSPSVGSVAFGSSFTQNRTCTYDQERFRSRTNLYPSGRTESLSAQRETRALTNQAQSQTATGTQEQEVSTYVTYSSWTNSGGAYSCTWSPSPSTIDIGTSFTQTGSCSQNQTRVATTWSKWLSGKADSQKSTASESRTISTSPTRGSTGTGAPTISYGAWSGYSTVSTTACTTWTPAESTVNLGSSFTQNRTCSYNQQRTRSRTNVYPSGRTEALSPETGTRTLTSQAESRTRTGSKDYVTSTYNTYSAWTTVANDKSCSGWTPAESTIDIGTGFTQNRTCVDGQSRVRTAMQKWASGKADTANGTATETRDVNDSQSRGSTGTGAPTISYGTWGSYSTYSVTACTSSSWSPATSTVNLGSSFTQTRSCTYNQERFRSRTNVYPSGRTEALSAERGTRSLTGQAESRTATGTKDYVTSNYNTYSSWTTVANDKSCTGWAPATSTIDIGTSFTQTQTCVDGQNRTRTAMQKWASGKADTVNSITTETRDVNDSQSRGATGTGAPTISYGTWGSYSTYSVTACTSSSWSPATSTVNLGSNFTQTRSCTYNQERFRSRTNVYPSGRTEALSADRGTRVLTGQAESRSATGTKDYVTSTYTSNGSYSVTRGDYSCSSWSPATSTHSCGSSFTQTMTCKNDESRTVRTMQRWASGRADTEQSRTTQTRTVDVTRTQGATGGAPTANAPTYDYTGWVTYSNDQSCTGWTPPASSGYIGQNVTQTQTCSDLQERNRTTVTTYTCGGATTRTGTIRETRTIADNQSRQVAGTTDPWVAQSGRQCDVTTERNKGAPYAASGSNWSPTSSSRGTSTAGYTQSRAGIQPREYQCYNTETNAVTGVPRRVNVAWENAPNDSYTFSRSISVTRTGPTNTGSPVYGTYSPAANTVCSGASFTQSRSVTQAREYTYTHRDSSTTVYTRTGAASSSTSTQTRGATGTKACSGNWAVTSGIKNKADGSSPAMQSSEFTTFANGTTGVSGTGLSPGTVCNPVGSTTSRTGSYQCAQRFTCSYTLNYTCQ